MAKILVVDDEIGIRELLSEILADEGYDVVTAENASSARKAVGAGGLDLVLLDIWMPDTDGVTLLKELTASRRITCPVVMMSGHATIDTAVEATKFGAVDFLEKPISMKRLLAAVRSALERRSNPKVDKLPKGEAKQDPVAVFYKPDRRQFGVISLSLPLREARDKFERLFLENLLEEEGYSMSRVANRAGLERTHLYRKIKQLEITIPQKDK